MPKTATRPRFPTDVPAAAAAAGAAARSAAGRVTGFWRGTVRGHPAGEFTAADVPDQTGRIVLVTGANSGIGLESALVLARHGARVLIACRDAGRGEIALRRVAATAAGPAPELVSLDLASLASIRRAAQQVGELTSRLDVLIDNAGVMATPQGRTADGFETQIGTNHLGPFALTGLLLPLLRVPAEQHVPRVVVVSSTAHRAGHVLVSDLNYEGRHYSPWGAYSQSKLANLLFARELQHRADAEHRPLLVACAHPGLASTNLMTGTAVGSTPVLGTLAKATVSALAQSPADGALPLLYAATMPDVAPLEYFGPGGLGEQAGAPVRVAAIPAAYDDGTAAALWIVSEKLTGVLLRLELTLPVDPPPSRWAFDTSSFAVAAGDSSWRLPDQGPDDVVGRGADLEPGTLLAAYRAGVFPMPVGRRGGPVWWCPARRGVLEPAALVRSRSLAKSTRRFVIRVDTAFPRVIAACAGSPRPGGWITRDLVRAYTALHDLGWAHSVEAWTPAGDLAGGLYGISIGGLFAGESMFHADTAVARDASKVALVGLVELLRDGDGDSDRNGRAGGRRLIDVQWLTPHLSSLGACAIPRSAYLARLPDLLSTPAPAIWR